MRLQRMFRSGHPHAGSNMAGGVPYMNPSRIVLFFVCAVMSAPVFAQSYSIPGEVVGSGGGAASGGGFILEGTVGQPVVGVMSGTGGITLGGFWYRPHDIATEVSEAENDLPREFALDQNYPNPFNPSTTIQFAVPKPAKVTLRVYDAIGREVVTLVDEVLVAAFHRVSFDGTRFASGVYFYRIQADAFVQTRKLILLK